MRFPFSASSRVPGVRRWRPGRWILAIGAALVVHALAVHWLGRHAGGRSPDAAQAPVTVELLRPRPVDTAKPPAPAPAAPPAPGRHAAAPKPAAPSGAAPKAAGLQATAQAVTPAQAARTAQTTQTAPTAPSAPPAPSPPALTAASTVAASAGTSPTNAGAGTAASGAGGTATGSRLGTGGVAAASGAANDGDRFMLPPSGDLQYDTLFNGMENAPSTIHWHSDGKTYTMLISIPVPFVGPYRYESAGHIDAFGLAPDHYTEQRGRRNPDETTFTRNATTAGTIAFSRTKAAMPLQAGTQDRFSMFMQLSGLVRGNPQRYTRGVTREFYVADNDSAESWPVVAVGMEAVRLRNGYLPALHFTRLPRRAGDTRRIDVWLAPALGYLPVRLVQTEPNGTQVELLYRAPPGTAVAAPVPAPKLAPAAIPPGPGTAAARVQPPDARP